MSVCTVTVVVDSWYHQRYSGDCHVSSRKPVLYVNRCLELSSSDASLDQTLRADACLELKPWGLQLYGQ